MIPSVVTKRGDKGITDLFGQGRISKDSLRLHVQGDIDELNAILGLVLSESLPEHVQPIVQHTQHTLFRAGADLATLISLNHKNIKRVRSEDIQYLEEQITRIESTLSEQVSFLLPKGPRATSLLHHARAVCRRAERSAVSLSRKESLNPNLLIYLNRLSDYLFVAARSVNMNMHVSEENVDYS